MILNRVNKIYTHYRDDNGVKMKVSKMCAETDGNIIASLVFSKPTFNDGP